MWYGEKSLVLLLILQVLFCSARGDSTAIAQSNSNQVLTEESYKQKNQQKRLDYLSIKKDIEDDAGEIFQNCSVKQSISRTPKVLSIDESLNKSNANITQHIKDVIRECIESADTADKFCMEDTNPQLRVGIDALSGLISGAAILSREAACGKYKNGIKILTAAIAGFQGTCAVMKARCQSKCQEALSYASTNVESQETAICDKVESLKNEILNVDLETNIERIAITMAPVKECIDRLKPQYESLAENVNTLTNVDWKKIDPMNHPFLIKFEGLNNKLMACNSEVNSTQLSLHTEKLKQNFMDSLILKKSKNQCSSCLKSIRKLKNPIALREKACGEYGTQLMLAGAGIAGLLQQVKSKDLCGKENLENHCDQSNSATWTVANCATFCSENANKNTSVCRCILNPQASGCRQLEQDVLSVQYKESRSLVKIEKDKSLAESDKKNKSSNLKNFPISPNAGLMNKLNADIQTKKNQQNNLKNQEEDPSLQITGAGGKSNWDKVSESYRGLSGQMLKDD